MTHQTIFHRADASPIDDDPTAIKKGLTNWGKNVIAEMNRLGIIIDLSHVSEGVMLGALEHSKAQVLFSHSGVFTVHNHHRNVKDNVLLKVKANNGLVMINFYTLFVGGNNTIFDVIGKFHFFKPKSQTPSHTQCGHLTNPTL